MGATAFGMSSLTRIQFDRACRTFIEKYSVLNGPVPAAGGLTGWAWSEHLSPGFGYMFRTVTFSSVQDIAPNLALESFDEVVEGDDDHATLPQSQSASLNSTQYVVYSATFQVPAFYFTIHDSYGSPLSLTDILKTFLFHRFTRDGTETTSFAITLPISSFPLLSQGDHPTLGTPCWYFHPCETSASVGEVMKEVLQDDWTEDERLVRWLEAWFMVLGTAVDLKY